MKTYLEKKEYSDAMEELKNETIFGLMGGIILMAVGVLNWLSAAKPWDVIFICVFFLGLAFLLLGVAAPSLLKYPYKAFRLWGNAVGKAVFAVLLAVLYFPLIFPVGLFLRRKRETQGYFAWKQAQPEPRSAFSDIARADGAAASPRRASYWGILYQLFSGLITNRKFILIPAVVILVIVGLILFFVSSNVMTAFIYTLF